MNTNTVTNHDGQNPLFEAYDNADINQFKKLIDQGEDINCIGDNQESLIKYVIRNQEYITNNKEFFDLLIDKGVDLSPNGSNDGLLTLSMIRQHDSYYTRKLLENKVNPNSFGMHTPASRNAFDNFPGRGSTAYGPPIFDAIFLGSTEYVKLFIEYNFDVNMCDHENRSVMEYFIRSCSFDKKNSSEMFSLFIDYGADLDMPDTMGANLLGTIIRCEKYHLLEILFEKYPNINLNHRNFEGVTPLMMAVSNGDIDSVKLLIKKGADLNYYNQNGENALIIAVFENKTEIFKLLLDAGADLLTKNKDNNDNTILHSLVERANKFVINANNYSWFDNYYKITAKKQPELLSIKNNKGETPIDIFKGKSRYCDEKRKLFNQLKTKYVSSKLNQDDRAN